ncbi:MAG: hypothetical protein HYV99_06770, partial [Betaproteobacteria bacterium]|nr:hypothetical protein [Betaproteobacteria bacterium]
LVNPGTPNLRVGIVAPDNKALNLGHIVADSGRVGIYAGLINHSGTIRADSAQVTDDGRIILAATKNVTLEPTSVLSASGAKGGTITVLGGETANIAGRLDASAPNGGDGGFVETSGANVTIDPSTVVTTMAPYGKTGTWLIDPPDFTIALVGGDITGAGLSTNLGLTSVVINSNLGATIGSGDIFVNDAVSWSSAFSLTLTAIRNVNVNSSITNTGGATVKLYAGWCDPTICTVGNTPQTPVINAGSGQIVLSAPVSVTSGGLPAGQVWLTAGSTISQAAAAPVTADQLLAASTGGDVLINLATNQVNTLAGSATGEFLFKNGRPLTIGSVNGVNGITVDASSGPVSISVEVTGSGLLSVNNDVRATTSGSNDAATITLLSGTGGITVSGATVRAQAGGGDSSGGEATVTLRTAGAIDINNGAVEAQGGSPSCCSWAGGNATVRLIAPDGITVRQASSVEARGGRAGSSGGSQGGHATVELCAGTYTTGCNASTSAGGIAINGSSVLAKGGDASSGIGGNATINLTAGSGGVPGIGITVDGSTVRASARADFNRGQHWYRVRQLPVRVGGARRT